jgi:hypothetical protein
MANWIGAKREHKKFMNVLLQSDMDIICCIRAREKTDFSNPTMPKSLGVLPICEKNFMFELTASVMMSNQGKTQKHLKVPSFLIDAFGNGQSYLGIETGKKIRAWLDKGKKDDPEIARLKSEALFVCEKGVNALTELWKSIPKEYKAVQSLKDHFALCSESAKAYDAQNVNEEESNPLETIKILFKELEFKLSSENIVLIESVIQEQKTDQYDKVIYQLNKLKNE